LRHAVSKWLPDWMSFDHALGLFLIDVAALVILARLFGAALERLGQPAVLGEILVGILIGPSLLQAVAPGLFSTLFPHDTLMLLLGAGNLGLVLFIFLVGLEIDQSTLREGFGGVLKISVSSFLLPFAAGVLVATFLLSSTTAGGDSKVAFALFLGTAFGCTAFPVLARILADCELEHSVVGSMSLAAAGILDLIGWIVLAAVLALAAGDGFGSVVYKLLAILIFLVALKVVVVRLMLRSLRMVQASGPVASFALLVAVVFGCAGATQLIGLHSVIGPLLLGLALPRQSLEGLLGPVRLHLAPLASGVLLPVYFAMAGISVNVSGLRGNDILQLAFLLAAATATKIAGTMVGARWAGLRWRDGLPLGVLMNTRGLMEVVLLNVGLGVGVLDERLYSELMVVALLATMMTGPLIRRLRTASKGRLWGDVGHRGRMALEPDPDPVPQHGF
jgi:Kef-type K+ transport system membrane component KefB